MAKPRPSVLKRQREQARRERKAAKAEKRAQRKADSSAGGDADEFTDPIVEQEIEDFDPETLNATDGGTA